MKGRKRVTRLYCASWPGYLESVHRTGIDCGANMGTGDAASLFGPAEYQPILDLGHVAKRV